MNKVGAFLLFLLFATTGCVAGHPEPSVTEFSAHYATAPVPVLRIVYSANTNGQFQPEAG